MAPCKFAQKVWNAQEAGAQGVSLHIPCWCYVLLCHRDLPRSLMFNQTHSMHIDDIVVPLQVIVVNYEDKHTTMEAPDDQDEISYKCGT